MHHQFQQHTTPFIAIINYTNHQPQCKTVTAAAVAIAAHSLTAMDTMPADTWWQIENRQKLLDIKSATVVFIVRIECLYAQQSNRQYIMQ